MRNVAKYIKEYEEKIEKRSDQEKRGAEIYREELVQLMDLSKDDYSLMMNSLDFGFMLGYEFGLKENSTIINRENIVDVLSKISVVLRTLDSLQESAFLYDADKVIGLPEEERSIEKEWENMRDWMENHYNVVSCMLEQSSIVLEEVNNKLGEWELKALHEEAKAEASEDTRK